MEINGFGYQDYNNYNYNEDQYEEWQRVAFDYANAS